MIKALLSRSLDARRRARPPVQPSARGSAQQQDRGRDERRFGTQGEQPPRDEGTQRLPQVARSGQAAELGALGPGVMVQQGVGQRRRDQADAQRHGRDRHAQRKHARHAWRRQHEARADRQHRGHPATLEAFAQRAPGEQPLGYQHEAAARDEQQGDGSDGCSQAHRTKQVEAGLEASDRIGGEACQDHAGPCETPVAHDRRGARLLGGPRPRRAQAPRQQGQEHNPQHGHDRQGQFHHPGHGLRAHAHHRPGQPCAEQRTGDKADEAGAGQQGESAIARRAVADVGQMGLRRRDHRGGTHARQDTGRVGLRKARGQGGAEHAGKVDGKSAHQYQAPTVPVRKTPPPRRAGEQSQGIGSAEQPHVACDLGRASRRDVAAQVEGQQGHPCAVSERLHESGGQQHGQGHAAHAVAAGSPDVAPGSGACTEAGVSHRRPTCSSRAPSVRRARCRPPARLRAVPPARSVQDPGGTCRGTTPSTGSRFGRRDARWQRPRWNRYPCRKPDPWSSSRTPW